MAKPDGSVDNVALGLKIKAVRAHRRRSQVEVARAIGVSQATYSSYERGEYELPLGALVAISRYLDVSAAWLLDLPEGIDKSPF